MVEKWTNHLLAKRIHAKWAWVSYIHQLWAKFKYEMCTKDFPGGDLMNAKEEGGSLDKLYYKILPYLGVNRVRSGLNGGM